MDTLNHGSILHAIIQYKIMFMYTVLNIWNKLHFYTNTNRCINKLSLVVAVPFCHT